MAIKRQGSERTPPLLQVLVFIVPFAVYLTTLPNGFVYDDVPQVIGNPWIRSFDNLGQVFSSSHWKFQGVHSNIYRPFFHLVLTIEYTLFGLKPWGYHLVNAVLHALNTFLLFHIVARLGSLERGKLPPGSEVETGLSLPGRAALNSLTLPFIAAMIFALHPVNTEPVSWISSIPELTYALFFLLSFLFFMTSSGGEGAGGLGTRRILSYLFFALALFCKEPALMLVPFVWFYEVLFGGSGGVDAGSLRGRFRRGAVTTLPYLLIAVFFLAVRGIIVGGLMHHAQIELTAQEVILNVFPLFASYIGKLLVPIGLNAVYEFYPVASPGDPRFIISAGATALFFLILAVLLLRGKRLAALPLLLIVLPIIPVLYVPALATVAFADRYLYLPVAGFAIFISLIFVSLLRAGARRGRWGAPATAAVMSTVLILYAGATLSRIQVWHDNLSLWTDTALKSPMNPDVRYNLGWTYHELGMIEEAKAEYKTTLSLNPGIDEARFNLAIIHLEGGEVREAYHELLTLRKLNPGYKEASRLISEIEAAEGFF